MRLLILQGLPGSGKTTYAKELGASWVRVNKDDIRAALKATGWVWSQAREKQDVLPERDRRIRETLRNGYNVVSDDTNLAGRHVDHLTAIAKEFDAEVEVKFIDTPVEECVRRDALRTGDAHVGEKVIRGMVAQLPQAPVTFAPYAPTPGLPTAIICDLDGTAALFERDDRSSPHYRNPYDCSRCDDVDYPNVPVRATLQAFMLQNKINEDLELPTVQFIYLSGRDSKFRPQTERFLAKHDFPTGQLHMRHEGDRRKDWIVKGELFNAHVRGRFNVLFVLDDRDQVVEFWRSLGLTVFQVAPGAF